MGTNYYWHRNVCDKCERSESVIHIGKSSGGWTFSFHGIKGEWDDVKIVSFDDWKKLLQQPNSRIMDEYEREVPYDDFVSLVEDKRDSDLNHTIYCREQAAAGAPGYTSVTQGCWLDQEGNSFSDGEFS